MSNGNTDNGQTPLVEWKIGVVSELVWAAMPQQERAKCWNDVAANAVFVYEDNLVEYQRGDSMFEQYEDNFINKNYILNHRTEIRDWLRDKGRFVGASGAGKSHIIYRGDGGDFKKHLDVQQKRLEALIERNNFNVETAKCVLPGEQFSTFAKQLSD